jgi:hypothetical protein
VSSFLVPIAVSAGVGPMVGRLSQIIVWVAALRKLGPGFDRLLADSAKVILCPKRKFTPLPDTRRRPVSLRYPVGLPITGLRACRYCADALPWGARPPAGQRLGVA